MQSTSRLLVRKRIATLFLLFTLGFFILGGRMFWVQFVRGAELSEKAAQNRTRDVPVESRALSMTVMAMIWLYRSVRLVYAIPAEVLASRRTK